MLFCRVLLLLSLICAAALDGRRLFEQPVDRVGRLAWPRMLRKPPLRKGRRSSGSCSSSLGLGFRADMLMD